MSASLWRYSAASTMPALTLTGIGRSAAARVKRRRCMSSIASHASSPEDHGELVAADAVDAVAGAHGRAHGVRDELDVLVAGLVAEGVVDDLEVVQVEQDQRERRGSAPQTGDGASQVLLEGSVVAQSGQRIARRQLRQRRDLPPPGARQSPAQADQDAAEGSDQRSPRANATLIARVAPPSSCRNCADSSSATREARPLLAYTAFCTAPKTGSTSSWSRRTTSAVLCWSTARNSASLARA